MAFLSRYKLRPRNKHLIKAETVGNGVSKTLEARQKFCKRENVSLKLNSLDGRICNINPAKWTIKVATNKKKSKTPEV